jgi:NTE family protein
MSAPRVGLVLGAGGAAGRAFHVGALAALEEVAGLDAREVEVVVGTSAGSIVGALLRAGLSARDYCAWTVGEPIGEEASRILGRRAADPPRADFPRGAWRPAAPGALLRAWRSRPGALGAALLPEGVVPSDGLRAYVDPLFGAAWPRRALWICAVRLDDGARVVFGREGAPPATVGEAVAASCAIPGWLAPVRIAGERYVDGGAWSFVNADVVLGLGLDVVVVSSTMSATGVAPLRSLDAAVRTASHLRLARSAARLRREGARVLVLEPDASDVEVMGTLRDAMDASRRPAVARHVRASMAERLRRAGAAELLGGAAGAGRRP